jgi:hypothetical protein
LPDGIDERSDFPLTIRSQFNLGETLFQQDLVAWFHTAYVNKLGHYLIDLYSGRLKVGMRGVRFWLAARGRCGSTTASLIAQRVEGSDMAWIATAAGACTSERELGTHPGREQVGVGWDAPRAVSEACPTGRFSLGHLRRNDAGQPLIVAHEIVEPRQHRAREGRGHEGVGDLHP